MKTNELPMGHKIELIAGFALSGATVGALTCFSWWGITEGALGGLLGAGIGGLLGYSILLPPLRMLMSWLVSLIPVYAGYYLGAQSGSVLAGLGSAIGGLGLGFFGFLNMNRTLFPAEIASGEESNPAALELPEGIPGEEETPSPETLASPQQSKVAPYRASRKKRK